jgi:tripartite-type tricarboxylate transporter receptor subunit TctC
MLACPAYTQPSLAQSWPAKPIRLIVSVSPGQANDIVGRLLADRLSRALGQQMYVENVAGASGMLGAQAAARAAPDGYTLFLGPMSVMATNIYTVKSLPYDPRHDFTAVAMLVDSAPFVIAANPSLPVTTLAELIAYAKAAPGKLSYAVVTSSAYASIIGQLLMKRAGIEMVQVPYSSNAQAVADTMAGTVPLLISAAVVIDGFVRAGKLRNIVITSHRRFPGSENLPTLDETIPGFVLDGWFTILAPVGTPAEIVARLNHEIDVFLKDPEVLQKFHALGISTSGADTPQRTAEFIRAEQERWGKIVQELDIQPQ